MENYCGNCFNSTQGYQVCPFCGFVDGTLNEPAFMLQPKMRLQNRFIVGTILGIGGFGVTYKAFDTRLASVVAIKEYFPQNLSSRMPGETDIKMFTGESSKAFMLHRQRFEQEGKNLAQFAGEVNIVNVLDNFNDNGTSYIVMEYLEGVTLKEFLAQNSGKLPWEKAVEILKGILSGLNSIHLKGIIHRDISPDNIYITNDGNVKLLDFGAARFAAKEEWTQSVIVKKGYAPPEQYRSNMKQSPQTDLYAAGATFYKMLTGQTPEESIERWEKDLLRRPSQIVQGLDAHLDKFTMKALALKSELRFSSAQSMLNALESDKGYDFPEEELKKRKTRSIITCVVAVLFVFAVIGVVLGSSLDENGNFQAPEIIIQGETLADKNIQSDSIKLVIYEFENENNKITTLVQEFNEVHPEYNVEIIYENELDDNSNEWDISTAYLQDMELADLSLLYNGLNEDDYYNLSFNENSMDFVPYSFLPYMLWTASDGLTSEVPEYIDSLEGYIEFANENNLQTDSFYLVTLLSIYANEDMLKEDGTLSESWENNLRTLYKSDVSNSVTGANNGYNGYSHVHWMMLSADDIQRARNQAQASTVAAFPILLNGSAVLDYNNEVYVNANSSENKQLVAMQFIHFMLSERGQTILNIMHSDGVPVNKKVAADFFELNTEVATLEPYLDNLVYSNRYVDYQIADAVGNVFENEIGNSYNYDIVDYKATTNENLIAYESELNEMADDFIVSVNSALSNY